MWSAGSSSSSGNCTCDVDFINKTLSYPDQKIVFALQSYSSKDVPSSSGSSSSGGGSGRASINTQKLKVQKITIEEVSTASCLNMTMLMKDLIHACSIVATASYCEKCYQQVVEGDHDGSNSGSHFGGIVTNNAGKAGKSKKSSKIFGYSLFLKHLHAIDGFALCSLTMQNNASTTSSISPSAASSSSSVPTTSTDAKSSKRLKPTLLRQGILLPVGANRAIIYIQDDSQITQNKESPTSTQHIFSNIWKKFYCEPKRDKRNPFLKPESNIMGLPDSESYSNLGVFDRNNLNRSRGIVALHKIDSNMTNSNHAASSSLSRSRSIRRESLEQMKEALLADEKSNHEKTLNEMFYSEDSDIQSIGSNSVLFRSQSRMSQQSVGSEDILSEDEIPTLANGGAGMEDIHAIDEAKSASQGIAISSPSTIPAESSPLLKAISNYATSPSDESNLFPLLNTGSAGNSMLTNTFPKEESLHFYVSATRLGESNDEESKLYIDGCNYIVLPNQHSGSNLSYYDHDAQGNAVYGGTANHSTSKQHDDNIRMVDAPKSIKITSPIATTSSQKESTPLIGGGTKPSLFSRVIETTSNLISFFTGSSPPANHNNSDIFHSLKHDEPEGNSDEVHDAVTDYDGGMDYHTEQDDYYATLDVSVAKDQEEDDDDVHSIPTYEYRNDDIEDDNRTESTVDEQNLLLEQEFLQMQQSIQLDLQPPNTINSAASTPAKKRIQDSKRSTSLTSVDSTDSATQPPGGSSNKASNSKSEEELKQLRDKLEIMFKVLEPNLVSYHDILECLQNMIMHFDQSPYLVSRGIVQHFLAIPHTTSKKKLTKDSKQQQGKKKDSEESARMKAIDKFFSCLHAILKQRIGSDRHVVKAFCSLATVNILVMLELFETCRLCIKKKEMEKQISHALSRLNLAVGSPVLINADMNYLFQLPPAGGYNAGIVNQVNIITSRIEYLVYLVKKLYQDKEDVWTKLSLLIEEYDYAKKVDNPSPIKSTPTSTQHSTASGGNSSVVLDSILSSVTNHIALGNGNSTTNTSGKNQISTNSSNNNNMMMPPPPPKQPADTTGLKSGMLPPAFDSNKKPTITRQNSLISERKPILGHRINMSRSRAVTVNPSISAYNMKIARSNSNNSLSSANTNTSNNNGKQLPTSNSSTSSSSTVTNANQMAKKNTSIAVAERFRRNFPDAKTNSNQYSPLSPSPKKPRRSLLDNEFSSPIPSTPMRFDPSYSQVDVVESTPMDVYNRYSQEARPQLSSGRKSAASQSVHDIFSYSSNSSFNSSASKKGGMQSPSFIGKSILEYTEDDEHDDSANSDYEVLRKNTRGMRSLSAAAASSSSSSSMANPSLDIVMATSTPVRNRNKKRDLSTMLDLGENVVIHHEINTGDSSEATEVASYQNSANSQQSKLNSSVETTGKNSNTNSVDVYEGRHEKKQPLRSSNRNKSSNSSQHIKSPVKTSSSLFE